MSNTSLVLIKSFKKYQFTSKKRVKVISKKFYFFFFIATKLLKLLFEKSSNFKTIKNQIRMNWILVFLYLSTKSYKFSLYKICKFKLFKLFAIRNYKKNRIFNDYLFF